MGHEPRDCAMNSSMHSAAAPPQAGKRSGAALAPLERPLVFEVAGQQLLGLLAQPVAALRDTAVLVLVGGPQVRAGSHRYFVQLARTLAAAGHPVLRFDARGMGDSEGSPAGFEGLHDDIAAAIGVLMAHCPGVRRVVLWGLCDAASAALLYLQRQPDPRVGGLVLVNPWVRSTQTLARTRLRHYYAGRLLQGGFWRKLLRGSVGRAAVQGWWQNLRAARRSADPATAAPGASTGICTGGTGGTGSTGGSFAQRMAQGWHAHRGPVLLLLSGDDVTAQEFADHARSDRAWRGALKHPLLQRCDLPGADHTFSDADSGQRVLQLTLAWLQAHSAAAGADAVTASPP